MRVGAESRVGGSTGSGANGALGRGDLKFKGREAGPSFISLSRARTTGEVGAGHRGLSWP